MMPPHNGTAYLMRSNNNDGSRAAWARGFLGLWTALAIGLGLMAPPAEAAPFAYVANDVSGTVSVFDTATNTVVATLPVGSDPFAVGVTPDGKHAYVANFSDNTVSVIDTVANTVVATVPVGSGPFGVAITPDGQHIYVANIGSNVSVV
jgi:YVTN family beta-propeller protein